MLPDLGDPGVRAPADGPSRLAWIDARRGVAGDALLGALVDAGAALPVVRDCVSAVLPGATLLTVREVRRGGLRATRCDARLRVREQPMRTWPDVRALLDAAELPAEVRTMAIGAFRHLAAALARVHGVPAHQVRFRQPGAWGPIVHIVGICAALHDLGVDRLVIGEPIALGSGTVDPDDAADEGGAGVDLSVPTPVALELARGFAVTAGGDGELTTTSTLALLRALATPGGHTDPLVPDRVGVGAGAEGPLLRLVLDAGDDVLPGVPQTVAPGDPIPPAESSLPGESGYVEDGLVTLEATVDDQDPRVWPSVLDALLRAGALEAWLTPVMLSGGRPGQVLNATVAAGDADLVAVLRDTIFALTSTFGVRARRHARWMLHRDWVPVDVAGERVRVRVGYVARPTAIIARVTPEAQDAVDLADRWGVSVTEVLTAASAAATAEGLVAGAPYAPGRWAT